MEIEVSSTETNTKEHVLTPSNDPLPSSEDKMQLKELIHLCTNLSNKVLDLENEVILMKSSYKAKIKELESRVEKLEEENMSLTKELKTINTCESIEDVVKDVEDVVASAENVKGINAAIILKISKNDVTLAQILIEIKAAKTKASEITMQEPSKFRTTLPSQSSLPSQAKDKEVKWNTDKKDNINWNEVVEQVKSRQLDAVRKYQDLKRKPLSVAQARKNMMIYLKNMAGYKMDYFKGMSYE
nr:hypothetical protein [Tanacetum cinerariifolium]